VKVGLLADVHGNSDALRAVLNKARRLGVTELLCCGDYVGYYYNPSEVLDLLDQWPWYGVRGNHESFLEQWLYGGNDHRIIIREKYGSGIKDAAEMADKKKDRLLNLGETLEMEIGGRSVLLCHGSPWDNNHYIYPDAIETESSRITEGKHDLVVLGHTHYPFMWREGQSLIVNPGSVGQPRDRKPGACWAVWDACEMTIELRREQYDMDKLMAMCQSRDPHLPYLQDVLKRNV